MSGGSRATTLASALVVVSLFVAGCASGGDSTTSSSEVAEVAQPGRAAVCRDFRDLVAQPPDPVEQRDDARDLLDIFDGTTPVGLEDALDVLADEGAGGDDRDAAIRQASLWLLQCLGPSDSGQTADRRLVPTRLPDDTRICLVADIGEMSAFEEPDPVDIAFWGDASLSDPWLGPVALVTTQNRDSLPAHDDSERVTIGSKPGWVAPMPLFQAVSNADWGHVATWNLSDGRVAEIAVKGMTAREVVAVAAGAIEHEGKVLLGNNSLGAQPQLLVAGEVPTPTAFDRLSVWQVSLQTGADITGEDFGDGGVITIRGLPTQDGFMEALDYLSVASSRVTIGDRDALQYAMFDATDGPWGLAWEDDGLFVQVVGIGTPLETVREVAESLADVDVDGWRDAQSRTADCFADLR